MAQGRIAPRPLGLSVSSRSTRGLGTNPGRDAGRNRNSKYPPGAFELDGLVLDQAGQEVTVNGESHHLTPKECRLLATLMQHAGQILTREFLMQEVWDTHYTGDTRTVEVHIAWLRKKLEEDTSNPQRILTVRGVGYMFTARS